MNKLKLYGKPDSPEVLPIKDFLERSQMSYEWIDISNDNLGWGQGITSFNNTDKHAVVEFSDGRILINPSLEQIISHL